MYTPVLTHDLADRIERARVNASVARHSEIQRMGGNPLGIEVRQYGRVTARLVHQNLAYYPYFNGPLDVRSEDEPHVPEMVAWYREEQRPCFFRISPFFCSDNLLATLANAGLRQSGFMTLLYGALDPADTDLPETIKENSSISPLEIAVAVEESPNYEHFPDLWTAGAPEAEIPLRQTLAEAEFALWRCYVGFVDGRPAAHAGLFVDAETGTAMLAAAATLPEFRGRGCQTALLQRRLADAAAAGATLAIAEASPGSISQRNMERTGLRTAYTKATWIWEPPHAHDRQS